MNLLTKEQQTIFNNSRKTIASHVEWSKQQELNPIPAIYQAAESLVRIIDDLQARAPKRYTEQELREHYENCFSAETGEDNTWDGWLECARFLGALKAES